MRIDGLPWRLYLWLCVKGIVLGALLAVGVVCGLERLTAWAAR